MINNNINLNLHVLHDVDTLRVRFLLYDVEVVPVSSPHGEHGTVLDQDAEGRGQHDLGHRGQGSRPGETVDVELPVNTEGRTSL